MRINDLQKMKHFILMCDAFNSITDSSNFYIGLFMIPINELESQKGICNAQTHLYT